MNAKRAPNINAVLAENIRALMDKITPGRGVRVCPNPDYSKRLLDIVATYC